MNEFGERVRRTMSGAHQAEAAPSEPRDLIQVNPRWFSLIHLLSVLCGLDMRSAPWQPRCSVRVRVRRAPAHECAACHDLTPAVPC